MPPVSCWAALKRARRLDPRLKRRRADAGRGDPARRGAVPHRRPAAWASRCRRLTTSSPRRSSRISAPSFGGAGTTAAGRLGRQPDDLARCSASTRTWSTARACRRPIAHPPTRSSTCWWGWPRRSLGQAPTSVGAVLRGDLAVAGETGTLARRMRNTGAQGRCQGKTGHAHRRLEPGRLLPVRGRASARLRDLQRRHLNRSRPHLPGPHGDHDRRLLIEHLAQALPHRARSRPAARPSGALTPGSPRRPRSRCSSTPSSSPAHRRP